MLRTVLVALAALLTLSGATSAQQGTAPDVAGAIAQLRRQIAAGQHAAAVSAALQLMSFAEARYGGGSIEHGNAVYEPARDLLRKRAWREAEAILRPGFSQLERAGRRGDEYIVNIGVAVLQIGQDTRHHAFMEWMLRRMLAAEARLGRQNHTNTLTLLFRLSRLLLDAQRYGDAELVIREARAKSEHIHGPASVQAARSLELMGLAREKLGRPAEAERSFLEAIGILEAIGGPAHPGIPSVLNALSGALRSAGRPPEDILPVMQRALQLELARPEQSDGRLAVTIQGNIAQLHLETGQLAEAEKATTEVIAAHARRRLPHPTAAVLRLGQIRQAQGRPAEAEKLMREAIARADREGWGRFPGTMTALGMLADLYLATGRPQQAEPLMRRSTATLAETMPRDPMHAESLDRLARVLLATRRPAEAAVLLERSRAIYEPVLARLRRDTSATAQEQLRAVSAAYVLQSHAAQRLAEAEPARRGTHQEAAWLSAQISRAALTGTSVAQAAARAAAPDPRLAGLVREAQDLALSIQAAQRRLGDLLSLDAAERRPEDSAELSREIASAEARLAATEAELRKGFPRLAELQAPRSLTLDETAQLLRPDEALVAWLVGERETLAFVIAREAGGNRVETFQIEHGRDALAASVERLRVGLDAEELIRGAERGKARLFDLGHAHALYRLLFGPAETILEGKRSLLLVPSGPLTAIPFQVLLTDAPPAASAAADALEPYRTAAWLARRHALTVLPDAASLRALRTTARPSPAPRPMIGFGDPDYGSTRAGPLRGAGRAAYARFWRGASVDTSALRGLTRLPESAEEVRAVGAVLGARSEDLLIGPAATETAVKRARLQDYRVVYFATHGLVAGDIRGLAEPALAMTLPDASTETDDGLLTASEVLGLRLTADWVVLSACNTAAGERPGAEALSGLARAFLYAGARSLLVSHWAVGSEQTTRLNALLFDALGRDRALSRAGAHQTAMLRYMADTSDPWNAYPAFWAAFVVVGDGN